MESIEPVAARWYDGTSAIRHTGTACWDGADFLLRTPDGTGVTVVGDDLVLTESTRDRRIYRRISNADFRVILPADLPPAFLVRLPGAANYGGWIDRVGLWRASAVLGLVSAALVAAFLTAPTWLGPRIPPSWERHIGDAMVGDIDRRMCHTPAADRAMEKLVTRLDPGNPKVRAGIANVGMVNAITLPGERIAVFNGLVQEAKSPDELAGVLGHEIGHVRERHVMTALLRQFGLSVLLAGANNGAVNNMSGLASMSYSRDAEREADAYARGRLAANHISPLGAAGFFDRMAAEAGSEEDRAIMGWIASHPSSQERAKAFRAAAAGKTFVPALTPTEFAALKSACKEDKTVEGWDLF